MVDTAGILLRYMVTAGVLPYFGCAGRQYTVCARSPPCLVRAITLATRELPRAVFGHGEFVGPYP